jgi:hypothetical protein
LLWITLGLDSSGRALPGDASAFEIGSRGDRLLSLQAFRDGAFVGFESVNRPADIMLARRTLARPEPMSFAEAEGAGFDLKSLASRGSAPV